MTEFLIAGILVGFITLAVLVCWHDRKRKYRGLELPKRRRR